MENAPKSDALAKSLIKFINNSANAQTLLCQIAENLGQFFRVDACLIVSGITAVETAHTGFWHKDNIAFAGIEDLFSHALFNDILTVSEPFSLAQWSRQANRSDGGCVEQLLSFESSLALKTEFQGTANGLIWLGVNQAHEWTEVEKKLLTEIRDLVAIACMMAQLQREASLVTDKEIPPNVSFSNLARGIPGQGTPLIKRLYELMRQQLEQQRQLNEMKDDIIDAISDKARNPLSSMKLAIDALSNPERQLPPQSQSTFWGILKKEWGSLNDLITNIVTLKKLESQELEFRPQTVDLIWLLNDIVRQFQEQWAQDRRKQLTLVITFESDNTFHLYTDPFHLRAILHELLYNAGNFSAPKTTVYLQASQNNLSENAQIVIKVNNIGIGIAQKEKMAIFEPFRRGTGITERAIAGTGMGLALVKGLVTLLNGTIEVASEPIQDSENYATSFTLTLPQTIPTQNA